MVAPKICSKSCLDRTGVSGSQSGNGLPPFVVLTRFGLYNCYVLLHLTKARAHACNPQQAGKCIRHICKAQPQKQERALQSEDTQKNRQTTRTHTVSRAHITTRTHNYRGGVEPSIINTISSVAGSSPAVRLLVANRFGTKRP